MSENKSDATDGQASKETMNPRTLKVGATQYADLCDGCGHKFTEGEKHLTGISSCCGGCYRILCRECVAWAYKQFQDLN